MAMVVMAGSAVAWDPIGHMIVNETAYAQLSPKARAAVDASMAAFNEKNKTAYTFVTAGCWMDDIRPTTREFNTWHYINLPYNETGEPFPPETQENVLQAMTLCADILAGKRTDPRIDRDQALVMLSHLVGDVHQPLHTTSRNNDLGGNKVDVPNIVDARVEVFPKWKNLHYFWDTSYRRTVKDGQVVETFSEPLYPIDQPLEGHNKTLPVVREQAPRLAAVYDPVKFPAAGAPADWVTESHGFGFNIAYKNLPGGDGANPAVLDAPYVDAARMLSEQRLIQAGKRLAAVIESALGDQKPAAR